MFLKKKVLIFLFLRLKLSFLIHSFANGLIFGKNDKGEYKVSVSGGYLLIKEIEINGKKHQQSKIFKLGKYLK